MQTWRGAEMARFAATERDLAAISDTFRSYILSWRRHLLAENKAPRTVQTYIESVNRFAAFLAEQGMPTDPTPTPLTSRRLV